MLKKKLNILKRIKTSWSRKANRSMCVVLSDWMWWALRRASIASRSYPMLYKCTPASTNVLNKISLKLMIIYYLKDGSSQANKWSMAWRWSFCPIKLEASKYVLTGRIFLRLNGTWAASRFIIPLFSRADVDFMADGHVLTMHLTGKCMNKTKSLPKYR